MMNPLMTSELVSIAPRTRFRAAMILALVADAVQLGLFPLFAPGAASKFSLPLTTCLAILIQMRS